MALTLTFLVQILEELLLSEDTPIYGYQNLELTNNDQIWSGGIAGLCNLERRRDVDMPATNRVLFHQLCTGLISPRPNYDPPMDAATRVMRYSAMLVECMWSMVEREQQRVHNCQGYATCLLVVGLWRNNGLMER